jgi:hypothetical protein
VRHGRHPRPSRHCAGGSTNCRKPSADLTSRQARRDR